MGVPGGWVLVAGEDLGTWRRAAAAGVAQSSPRRALARGEWEKKRRGRPGSRSLKSEL